MPDITNKTTMLSIAIVAAGLIGVISVFLTWYVPDQLLTFSGWDTWNTFNDVPETGGGALFDFSRIGENFYPVDPVPVPYQMYAWIPLLVLIISAVALVLGVCSAAMPKRIYAVGTMISGAIVVVLVLVFITYSETVMGIPVSMLNFAGIGVYFGFVAGGLMILFGFMNLSYVGKTSAV
ncbi:MAG: hypothetical protein FWC44_01925 [Methanomassiliicoccaceae archaeon]|nr:hypothetical protein [Methanomassiliicoccaceae archaeon]